MVTTQVVQFGSKRGNTHNKESQAVVAGDFMYLSGQTAKDRRTQQVVGATTAEQLQVIFTNIRLILSTQSLELANVVKLTAFMRDESDLPAFEAALSTYFGQRLPACTVVYADRLKEAAARICLEAVAYVERD